jgi:vacuolar-type H+-ATPase subunit E/Vma4
MELEEKMDYFVEQVDARAEDTIENQMNNYQETLENDYETFKKRVNASFTDRLEAEKNALRKENNKQISKIRFNHQHDLYVQEEKLKKSLFEKFRRVLKEYKETNEYVEHLKKMIQNVQEYAKEERYEIYIDPSDQQLLAELEEFSNVELNISDRDFIGGIRGVVRDRGVLLDYSFSTLLTRTEENFSITEGLNE